MPAILLSPLVKWSFAALGGAMVVHWVVKEARRINDELDERRRVRVRITDREALDAFHYLCRTEGIIPALESSHAVAYALKLAPTMRPDQSILVNLSGRGDKDIGTVADLAGVDFYDRPSMRGLSVKGAGSHAGAPHPQNAGGAR